MLVSAKYVLKENISNIYRIYTITKYEILGEIYDSKLGIFWKFASPTISILTYWFLFGFVLNRKAVDGIPYMVWMLGGMIVWYLVRPCITSGCSAIYKKADVITKMKFPVSILPMTVVLKKVFDDLCLFVVLIIVFAIYGYYPTVYWFGLLYYMLCAIIFAFSLSLTTSVLTMMARDTKKLITSCMRMILYLTPILWNIKRFDNLPILKKIVMCNPIYYIVQGYRDCFFYHRGIMAYTFSMTWFWGITIALFFFGSYMMYKFKTRFIDMI